MFVSTNKEVIKMSFAYTMKFHSVIKKIEYTETIKFAGKWMRLESLILSEVTQVQEDKTLHVLSCEDPSF